uniref:Uncharacterized protein LOC100178244 n=1 Tax=Phallusia mammillata TaxID=59560 RepID=A0A6F9DHI5_9ASCI|nr:uncharacterized protein LOC100178244 [Phallusia mammillata]
MTNAQVRTENDTDPGQQGNLAGCCCTFLFVMMGFSCSVAGTAVMSSHKMTLFGLTLSIIGVVILIFSMVKGYKCLKNKPIEEPVAGTTITAATNGNQQHPFLEQQIRNEPILTMESNLNTAHVVYISNHPSSVGAYTGPNLQLETSYPIDVDPNCSPPSFSASSAYPLKPQSTEPAPPSYEEAVKT